MIKKRTEYFSPKVSAHNSSISSIYVEHEPESVDQLYFAVLPHFAPASGGPAAVMILEEHFQEIMDYFQRKLVVHVRGMGKATAINENTFIPRLESTYFEAAT